MIVSDNWKGLGNIFDIPEPLMLVPIRNLLAHLFLS
jgi:hypothetical protein